MIKFLRFVKTSSSVVTRKREYSTTMVVVRLREGATWGKKGWAVIPSNEDLMFFHRFMVAECYPFDDAELFSATRRTGRGRGVKITLNTN